MPKKSKLDPQVFLNAAKMIFERTNYGCCWAICDGFEIFSKFVKSGSSKFVKLRPYLVFFEDMFTWRKDKNGSALDERNYDDDYHAHWIKFPGEAKEARITALLICYWELKFSQKKLKRKKNK